MSNLSMNSMTSPASYASSSSLLGGGGGSSSGGGDRKVKTGWASIKEDGIKSFIWTKKYLILREYALDFNKNETATSSSLTIPLKDIIAVNRVDTKPYCFEIVRSTNASSGASMTSLANDAPRRVVLVSVKTDAELYSWIDEVYQRCPSMGGVSNPTNFTHKVHVGFDPVSGGFTGLPDEWEKLLTASAITREDYAKNPQAVLEVLEFYSDIRQRQGQPEAFSSMVPTPPGTSAAQSNKMGMGMPLQQQVPQNSQYNEKSYESNRERERRDIEQMERDAYRDREYEKQQRDQQIQRERLERERADREREEQKRREIEREREDQKRREDEYFNKGDDYGERQRTDQQPIMFSGGGGGGGGVGVAASLSSNGRYNPMRQPPAPPKGSQQPKQPQQRAAPSPPSQVSRIPQPSNKPTPALPASSQSSRSRNDSPSGEAAPSPVRRAPTAPTQHSRSQPNTPQQQARAPPNASNNTVKPLNVPNKTPLAKEDQAKKAAARISNMNEAQVMEKLRSVVSPGDPNSSYTKIKKVGQGASGSVYVAKVNSGATHSPAYAMLSQARGAPITRVAIKQMDLAHQPRKELIVNEILVMKESTHPNIVNFLDAFLRGNSELWVVMEYMEGGALTDVIDNNSLEEDQIATICHEVSILFHQN